MRRKLLTFAICLTVPVALEAAHQQGEKASGPATACPMHPAHSHSSEPLPAMNGRGEKGMGFSQTATAHHFLLKPDGGVIQVEVKNPANAADRDLIRKHLVHIAQAFGEGDFEIPMFVHGTLPPGSAEMKRLRGKIKYSFEEAPQGGRVVIATADQKAVTAIHKFLRFQIEEHATGDPTEVR
jgi:hypothetical protein